jgi:hypothetical protein
MINIAEMLSDFDFCQEFTVYRQIGHWLSGDFIVNELTLIYYGIILPATSKDLEQVPEGDRITGWMVFYAPADTPLYVTQNYDPEGSTTDKLTSDQCFWRNKRYRVYQVNSYDDYGYMKALCAYMSSD